MHKIGYDEFILSLSYSVGKLAGFENCTNSKNWEHKLYSCYNEHIHLLFINKKI